MPRILAAAVAVLLLLPLVACSSSKDKKALAAVVTSQATSQPSATAVPQASPPPPIAPTQPPPTDPPFRSCEVIRATGLYLSDAERNYFLSSCIIVAPTSTPRPPQSATTQITSVTSPVRTGNTATLNARTQPGASCSIAYVSPLGTVSQAQGLFAKASDQAGNVSWSWTIGTNTRPGTGTVTVTCAGQPVSAKIQIV